MSQDEYWSFTNFLLDNSLGQNTFTVKNSFTPVLFVQHRSELKMTKMSNIVWSMSVKWNVGAVSTRRIYFKKLENQKRSKSSLCRFFVLEIYQLFVDDDLSRRFTCWFLTSVQIKDAEALQLSYKTLVVHYNLHIAIFYKSRSNTPMDKVITYTDSDKERRIQFLCFELFISHLKCNLALWHLLCWGTVSLSWLHLSHVTTDVRCRSRDRAHFHLYSGKSAR